VGKEQVGAAIVAAILIFVSATTCTLEERTDRPAVAAATEPDTVSSVFLRPWGDAGPPLGVRSGDLVWIWAMQGTIPGVTPPRLVAGGAGPEARQALANITEVLAVAGAEPRDVAQCSIFAAGSLDAAAASAAYLESFGVAPTRTAVVDRELALRARVEIECTAVLTETM
jgi:enamine deaminase RidA (YjgF/YER057c/UK114 family)